MLIPLCVFIYTKVCLLWYAQIGNRSLIEKVFMTVQMKERLYGLLWKWSPRLLGVSITQVGLPMDWKSFGGGSSRGGQN